MQSGIVTRSFLLPNQSPIPTKTKTTTIKTVSACPGVWKETLNQVARTWSCYAFTASAVTGTSWRICAMM